MHVKAGTFDLSCSVSNYYVTHIKLAPSHRQKSDLDRMWQDDKVLQYFLQHLHWHINSGCFMYMIS